jgi:Tn3 transposase DDE domain
MPRRRALATAQLDELFTLPTEKATLVKYWTLTNVDLAAIYRLRDRAAEALQYRASGLALVTAAIALWNTVYLQSCIG